MEEIQPPAAPEPQPAAEPNHNEAFLMSIPTEVFKINRR